MTRKPLNILVLAGGPDKERPVSLQSGEQVAAALMGAGHHVTVRDITPGDTAALDEFIEQRGDVIFPALHGPWGEGGGLQQILDSRNLPYVGCNEAAARRCIDKHQTKQIFLANKLATPEYEVLTDSQPLTLAPPLVIKPLAEGSSIDILICPDRQAVERGRVQLAGRYDQLMYEQFIAGRELTVGVIESPDQPDPVALPIIEIVAATDFYDYDAKYERDDTEYLFDSDLPAELIRQIQTLAICAHRVLGCRHLSRVDFILDQSGMPWLLEVNTIPGFTSHSLLPKAAARAGINFSSLTNQLVQLACRR